MIAGVMASWPDSCKGLAETGTDRIKGTEGNGPSV